jgi:hypothetical protein
MGRFFKEWGILLAGPWKWFKGVSDVYKLISTSVLASLSALAAIWGSVPWWVVPVVALASFYVFLTAGLAWERSRGPWVTVSELRLDTDLLTTYPDGQKMKADLFFVELTNGDIPATPRVQIVAVSGGVKWIGRSYDAHWRGHPALPGIYPPLTMGEQQQFGLLVTSKSANGNHALSICDRYNQFLTVTKDVPLSEQDLIRLKVNVTCQSQSNELGKKQEFFFTVAPDTSTEAPNGGYKIHDIHHNPRQRWKWWMKRYRRLLRSVERRSSNHR